MAGSAILIAAIFFISLVPTMVGLGGGLIFSPLFVILGFAKSEAASASLFLNLIAAASSTFIVCFSSLAGFLGYVSMQNIDWRFILPAALASFAGGIQRVVTKDPGAGDQIKLIRRHLTQEEEKLQRGDFSDPARLHGEDMAGLRDLQAAASRIRISYADVPAGAEIRFDTSDIHLITAVHRWFGAQLSEHGADAVNDVAKL